jgi:FKBP-type peptidyl-prolyl cis-trans isomerase
MMHPTRSLLPFLLLALAATAPSQIPDCTGESTTTASGLQYCVLQKGREEPSPQANDTVEVHYTGWLTSGKEFDSSRKRGTPAKFALNQVIKGWTEGVQLMTPGARFKFVIPPELGYGDRQSEAIPANSTLVFEVELLRVIAMPRFVAANKENQRDLPSGGKWEMIKPGTGAAPEEADAVAFGYAIFEPDGKLLHCSEQRDPRHLISGKKEDLPLPALKDLCSLMKVGGVVRMEVETPAGFVKREAAQTVWLVELVGIHHVPKFRALDAQKTITTQSGLKYEVLVQGDGPLPKATSTVSVLYTGWLTDGTVFDSAHARGMEAEFPLNGVIKGWTEGLQLMANGSSFLFEIPAELAYGVRGSPPKIGPNATLIFLVELHQVK